MRGPDEIFYNMDALMKEQGKLEKDLISYLGLSLGTYSQWRIGNGHSYLRYIKHICDYLHVTPNTLILGKKDICTDIEGNAFTSDELDLVALYRMMTPKEQKCMRIIMQTFTSEEIKI